MTAGTFPNRCEAFRPPSGENGKAWDQGETYDDVKQLFTSGKAKLAASKRTAEEVARVQAAGLEDGGGKRRKRQGGGAGATRTVGVLSHLRLADLSQVAQESKILEGVRAWVVAKDEGRKREVDPLVHRLGGSPRANHIVSGAERTTLIVDGDPAPGNALIKRDNPDATDDLLAHSISVLKRHGIVDLLRAARVAHALWSPQR